MAIPPLQCQTDDMHVIYCTISEIFKHGKNIRMATEIRLFVWQRYDFILHIVKQRCLTHFTICIEFAQSERLLDLCRHRKMPLPWCIRLFRSFAEISTVAVYLGLRKMSFELILSGSLNLKVVRHRKNAVVSKLIIGKSLFYMIKSIAYSDIGKCQSLEVISLFDRNRCIVSCVYLFIVFRTVSAGILDQRAAVQRSPSRMDKSQCISIFSSNPFCLYSIFFSGEFFSTFESSHLHLLQNGSRGRNYHPGCFSMWHRFSSFV